MFSTDSSGHRDERGAHLRIEVVCLRAPDDRGENRPFSSKHHDPEFPEADLAQLALPMGKRIFDEVLDRHHPPPHDFGILVLVSVSRVVLQEISASMKEEDI